MEDGPLLCLCGGEAIDTPGPISYNTTMKKLRIALIIMVMVALYTQTPSFQWFKSMAVMSVYSTYEARTSLLHDEGIRIKIPGGTATKKQDWYPFVITFNDDRGFSRYTGRDLRMTVLYNFGYFPFWRSWSAYYDRESPYYNSFYGAYAIKVEDGEPFGFPEGQADIEEMGLVPTFDMERLVLSSIGLYDPVFSYEVTDFRTVPLIGEEGWQLFDADMKVSGAMHAFKKDHRAYIQYGRPPKIEEAIVDYEVIDMKGRIYGKYYPERDISLFFYCIATDEQVIEAWEETMMAGTEVVFP